jgi:hypothetical protein
MVHGDFRLVFRHRAMGHVEPRHTWVDVQMGDFNGDGHMVTCGQVGRYPQWRRCIEVRGQPKKALISSRVESDCLMVT